MKMIKLKIINQKKKIMNIEIIKMKINKMKMEKRRSSSNMTQEMTLNMMKDLTINKIAKRMIIKKKIQIQTKKMNSINKILKIVK